MHRTTAALFASIVIASAACAQSRFTRYERVEIGDTIPNITLRDTEGTMRTLDALRDEKPTLLYVWSPMGANDSSRDIDALVALDTAYDRRATIVAIASSHMERESIIGAAERLDMPFTVLIDDTFSTFSLFESDASNSLTILDADGTIVSRFLDTDRDRFDTARTHLDALLAGEPVPGPDRPGARDENDTVRALNLVTVDNREYSGVASKDFGARVALTMTDGNAEILTPEGETVTAPRRKRLDFWGAYRQELVQEADGHTRIAGMLDNRGAIVLYSLTDRGHLVTGLFDGTANQIAAADLDNDGTDEIIAGHNGSEGVAAFAGESLLWHTKNHGNIWTIDAGDLTGDTTPEIVHTHAGRTFIVLDHTGAVIRDIRLAISPHTVRVMPRPEGEDALVFVMDTGHNNSNGNRFGVVDLRGKSVWRRAVKLDDGFRPTIEPAPDNSAVAMLAGRDLLLFDNTTGDTIGHAFVDNALGMYWRSAEDNAAPELYVVTERARFRVDAP